ncbi:sterol desaturase family protein [Oscillatoria acuminata]|uniref:Sterol desaturase n=1 Tax=Oscillatoria acuminata PCC 6304 TaxID=56110 RepID=K9TAC4_9CYAN|nr:sterol desaturase family protein [Oscillatoria acuminata]AFY79812.1 sterol desaturase [Oscillatoria acuminata PCC 6304]
MAIFIAFVTLLILTVARPENWSKFKAKSWQDWLLDGIGLCFQGILIPALQIVLIYQVYQHFLPASRGILNFHPLLCFCLSFVGVDYLYYWNHRLLHSRWLWRLHLVHHTMTERQVLGTSRNTLWTSFLIVYLWIHALFIYWLQDPTAYMIGVSLTAILDLWRHSEIEPLPGTLLHRLLSPWLILPVDHAWHHAQDSGGVNYGANLKLWDRLHRTNYESNIAPNALGIPIRLTLVQKLIWPF